MTFEMFFEQIKKYSKEVFSKEDDKQLIKIYNKEIEDYELGCAINLIISENKYECYMFAGKGSDKIISNILAMSFDEQEQCQKYYEELVNLVDTNNLEAIIKYCENNR